MNWYLFRNERIYGPYEIEQLAAFLNREDIVAREGAASWTSAGDDPMLDDLFNGAYQPKLEWFITRQGLPTRGPFTLYALKKIFERSEIGPDDLVRHETWTAEARFGDTKLHRLLTTPGLRLDQITPDMIDVTPRRKSSSAPPPAPTPEQQKGLMARLPKANFEITPTVAVLAALLVLGPIGIYYWYTTVYMTSDAHFYSTHGGKPEGPCCPGCTAETYCRICSERPDLCTCNEPGGCKVYACRVYRMMQNPGGTGMPPPAAPPQ